MAYKPLTGYRVIDLTQFVAGPACTQQLAELGAEVIKIEFAQGGDPARQLDYRKNNVSSYFVQHNRGKKSVALNLKSKEGQEIVRELLKTADVFVENFSPGAVIRMGLGYEEVRKIKPDIIMCSVSSHGQTGPLAEAPGLDWIGGAWSGVLDLMGSPDGPPSPVTFGLGDVSTAVHAASAVLGALLHRERTGQGQHLDVSLLDSYAYLMDSYVGSITVEGSDYVPRRSGGQNDQVYPVGVFKGRDNYFVIMVTTDPHFERLAAALGEPELAQDPRFATNDARRDNRADLRQKIDSWLQSGTTEEMTAQLAANRVPAAPILTLKEAVAHPHLRERGTYRPIHDPVLGEFYIPGLPFRSSQGGTDSSLISPHHGEHSRQVLEEILGWNKDKVEELERSGVVRSA